ncbi:MAG: O-antigen ligase family protein, partial [Actinomycetota bacterium]|nr:O-antigen ligase family protein [Actinomycetota bacterium]
EDQGLWRAATTLTYANAASGLLAPLALLALGRSAAGLRNPVSSVASWALLVGVGATLSRAGVLALTVGLVALAVLLRPAGALRVVLGPAAGALVAVAGLLPSVPAESSPRPLLAVVALLAGLAVVVGMATVRVPRAVILLAVTLVVGAVGVAAVGTDAVGSIREKRLVLTSSDRARELIAALDVARDHPVAGVGPGRAPLEWTGPDGRPLRARYAHNEYVQVLAELGVVGLGLLLVALSAAARVVVRSGQAVRSRPIWMGASAGLVALAVGSAFDFLWHVPAVPLVGALLFGLATPHHDCAAPAASPQPSKPIEKEQPCA